jgi:hypothetical protein
MLTEDELNKLRYIRIKFSLPKDKENGFYTLMISGQPVRCLKNGVYIISPSQRRMLEEKAIPFVMIKT